jgi:FlaA1/EpsC-like NDP-sugar epimerase
MKVVAEPAGSLLAPEISDASFITDLAHFMAQKLAPERPVELDFTTTRPGKKDPHHFWSAPGSPRPAAQRGLLSIQYPPIDVPALESSLGELRAATEARDAGSPLEQLCELLPEYTPGAAVRSARSERVSS